MSIIYLQIFDNTLKTCFRRFGNTLCLEVKIKASRLIMYLFLVFVIFTLVNIPMEVASSVIGTTHFPGNYFMHRDPDFCYQIQTLNIWLYLLIITIFDFSGQECSGTVILSNMRNDTKNIASFELSSRRRYNLRQDYRRNKKMYPLLMADLYGNCCWRLWSKYLGGRPCPMPNPNKYLPGWTIKSVVLVKNCYFE